MGILAPRTVGNVRKQICVEGPSSTSAQSTNLSPLPEKVVDTAATKPLKAVSTGVKKSTNASSKVKRTTPANVFVNCHKKPRKGSQAAKHAEILRNGKFFPTTALAPPPPKPVRTILPQPAPQANLTPELQGARVLASRARQPNIDNCLVPNKCLDLPAKQVAPPGTITPADRCAQALKDIRLLKFRTKSDFSQSTMASLATACGFDKLDDLSLAYSRLQEYIFEAADLCVRYRNELLRSRTPTGDQHFYIKINDKLRERYQNRDSIDAAKIGAVALRELLDALVVARFNFKFCNEDEHDESVLTYIADKWAETWEKKKQM